MGCLVRELNFSSYYVSLSENSANDGLIRLDKFVSWFTHEINYLFFY
jgi:hypothetical protein